MTCYYDPAAAPGKLRGVSLGGDVQIWLTLCGVWRRPDGFTDDNATCPECRAQAGEPPPEGDD